VNAPIVSLLPLTDEPVEVVERKGLGHPDTICDAMAETFSRQLCRVYLNRYGAILHHNVDKALLCGGRAAPVFGEGTVLAPIEIYLAGRAVSEVAGHRIPIDELAVESAKGWLRANMHALDPDLHVQIHPRIQPGSSDLQSLFLSTARRGIALANDSSIGVGHAPLSPLERLVLAVEHKINGRDRARRNPAWGEDVKVLGIRREDAVEMTVACAMIGRHLLNMDDYLAEKAAIEELVRRLAAEQGFTTCTTGVNLADDPGAGSVYLTVTGTSAEAGDDGQVGRGNRVNGLITPYRPMSLEAAAGKNPVSHVGKIYNIAAQQIAESLLMASQQVLRAECLLVSKIGAPVTDPAIVHIRLALAEGEVTAQLEEYASQVALDHLNGLPLLLERVIAGTIELF
jgi:S-adenosylmethionine synthetase